MAQKKAKRRVRRPYEREDVKLLRQHSKARTPVVEIAKQMKRTEGSLRQKARELAVPLGPVGRSAVRQGTVLPRGEIRPLLTPEMIRRARVEVGLDQGKLAQLAGISRKTIVNVEADLPVKVDARRRRVLERVRKVFEREFGLSFEFDQVVRKAD